MGNNILKQILKQLKIPKARGALGKRGGQGRNEKQTRP